MDIISEDDLFIYKTFARIKDQYGQILDVTTAIPSLKSIMTETDHHLYEKHYSFTGEAALRLAVKQILVKLFPKDNDKDLNSMFTKVYVPQKLAKNVYKIFGLRKHMKSLGNIVPFESIVGVLFCFYGISAVEGFIEESVKTSVQSVFEECPKVKDMGVVYELNHMMTSGGGKIEYTFTGSTTSEVWEIIVMACFREDSVCFSHRRSGPSKKKARIAAVKDVLEYIRTHPDIREKAATTEVYTLPIPTSDYCDIESTENTASVNTASVKTPSVKTTTTAKKKELGMDSINMTYVPFSSNDEAICQLSELLLADVPHHNNLMSNKRQRDTKGMDPFMNTDVMKIDPLIKKESIFAPFN